MTPEQLNEADIFREEAYEVIDSWVDKAVAETGPICQPGCADCCHLVVTVSLLEAVIILRNEMGRAAYEVRQHEIIDTANLFLARDPSTRLSAWKKRGERCVFLGDCDRCVVYEDRPFNCRTHLAARPCEPGQDGNYFVDPVEATHLGLILNAAGAQNVGIPFAVAPLHFALLIADALLKADVQTVEKAYAGTPFLDPMKSALYWSYIEM